MYLKINVDKYRKENHVKNFMPENLIWLRVKLLLTTTYSLVVLKVPIKNKHTTKHFVLWKKNFQYFCFWRYYKCTEFMGFCAQCRRVARKLSGGFSFFVWMENFRGDFGNLGFIFSKNSSKLKKFSIDPNTPPYLHNAFYCSL